MAVSQNEKKSTDSLSSLNSNVTSQEDEQTSAIIKPQIHLFKSTANATTSNGQCVIENTTTNNLNDKNASSTNCEVNDVKESEANGILKVENLQQLSTNALPPYTPGSPPRFTNLDIKAFDTHCCTDCGDTFALKASLNFHLERRSVLIKFPCETCKNTCIFYNRCNLLSHIRSHIDKYEKSDLGKAMVSVVPRVFMDGIQNDFVNALDDDLDSIYDSDVLSPSELLECSLQEYEECIPEQQNETTNEPLTFAKVKCLECNEEFDSAHDRREHLTNGDKMPTVVSACNKCGLFCPSKCSLKAHQRIHLQISPYVCPECGESPDPHWSKFLDHVNYKCFHKCRSVGYKCPICKRVSPNNDSLLKHMELHTEKYAKCFECPRAYNSAEAFKQHSVQIHNGNRVRYTMIYKCSLCDIVFVNADQMLSHRGTHLKEQVCEYVFNCMQCGKPLESKAQLKEHIRQYHPKIYKQNVRMESAPTKPSALNFATTQYKGTLECLLCGSTFYGHQGYNAHLLRAHKHINQPCDYCSWTVSSRKDMIKHGKSHLEDKAVVCLLCNNKKMSNLNELDSHLSNHLKKLKFCSFCPICDRLFPNLPDAMNHLRLEHFLPVKNVPCESSLTGNVSSPTSDYVCHFCRHSFGN